MEDNASHTFLELERKIDAIWKSVEKTRRYFQITMWITVLFLVLPLVAIIFVLPMFLNSYLGFLGGSAESSSAGSTEQSQFEILRDLLQ